MSPVCFVTEVLSTLRGSAPIARRKGFPSVFRAALVQTSAALRPFHSSFASAPRVGDTPPHCALLPPPSPGGVRHVHAAFQRGRAKARTHKERHHEQQRHHRQNHHHRQQETTHQAG